MDYFYLVVGPIRGHERFPVVRHKDDWVFDQTHCLHPQCQQAKVLIRLTPGLRRLDSLNHWQEQAFEHNNGGLLVQGLLGLDPITRP